MLVDVALVLTMRDLIAEFGTAGIGAIGSAHSTVEELYLLAQLVRGMGSESVDVRTRHADFANVAPPGQARPQQPMAEELGNECFGRKGPCRQGHQRGQRRVRQGLCRKKDTEGLRLSFGREKEKQIPFSG